MIEELCCAGAGLAVLFLVVFGLLGLAKVIE